MADLVDRFRAGDPDAVRELYRRYGGSVHAISRSILGNAELAADATQQTFTKAWSNADRFDPEREIGPWLHTIARRTALDVLRTERRPTIGGHAPEVDRAVTTTSFETTWEIHEVRTAIDALPPDEREVVRLSHLVGLSHSEIAERLDIAVGTVKSRSHRAHRRLVATLSHLRSDARAVPNTGADEGGAP